MAYTTNELMAGARCVDSCVPDGFKMAVLIYLLNLINDNLNVSVLGYDPRGDTTTTTLLTGTTALAVNAERRSATIRNLSTSDMYIKLGAGCTNVIGGYWEYLPGADVQDDWPSGYSIDIENYTGIITVAGANLRYLATENYKA